MKISKRIAAFFLSITMLFSCFFLSSCTELGSVHGCYHLVQMLYKEDGPMSVVNLNIWENWLSQGVYSKLDLQEDGRAELRSKSEDVETVTRGSWSVADDGSIHLLFEDQLTIATLDGSFLSMESNALKLTFKKVLFDFTALTAE